METGRNEARAVATACAVATDQGVRCEQAAVVHSGSNVLVHLRPAPVVARVMTGTAVLHDDPQRWLDREVSVLNFLAPSGMAVRPSSLIDPGPYHQSGLWLTFWEWMGDHARAELDHGPARLGRALRDLHDAMSEFTGELGGLLDVQHDIERLHRQLRPTGAPSRRTIDCLRNRLLALSTPVFAAPRPTQALHGDVSLSNLLSTNERLVWNDFEDTFRGPVHWDVAGFVISLRDRGADPTFVARALDAYGWPDEGDLAPFIEAHTVYGEIWQLYDAQRRRRTRSLRRSSPTRTV
jgi:hypothetical protein